MSTVVERWVICDRCGANSIDGNRFYPSNKKMAEDLILNSGWDINLRKDKALCPVCNPNSTEKGKNDTCG